MRQALGRFPESRLLAPPNRQAMQPLVAAQPAENGRQLPMQPALSLIDWTNVLVPRSEPSSAEQQASPLICMLNMQTFSVQLPSEARSWRLSYWKDMQACRAFLVDGLLGQLFCRLSPRWERSICHRAQGKMTLGIGPTVMWRLTAPLLPIVFPER